MTVFPYLLPVLKNAIIFYRVTSFAHKLAIPSIDGWIKPEESLHDMNCFYELHANALRL